MDIKTEIENLAKLIYEFIFYIKYEIRFPSYTSYQINKSTLFNIPNETLISFHTDFKKTLNEINNHTSELKYNIEDIKIIQINGDHTGRDKISIRLIVKNKHSNKSIIIDISIDFIFITRVVFEIEQLTEYHRKAYCLLNFETEEDRKKLCFFIHTIINYIYANKYDDLLLSIEESNEKFIGTLLSLIV